MDGTVKRYVMGVLADDICEAFGITKQELSKRVNAYCKSRNPGYYQFLLDQLQETGKKPKTSVDIRVLRHNMEKFQ